MPLNPEEEQKLRDEIRRRLEERERREVESRELQQEEKRRQLEERMRAKIKAEEEERFYRERGYEEYINHYGQREWRRPDEIKESRRKRSGSSRHSRHSRKLYKTYIVNIALIGAALLLFGFLYYYNPFKPPARGKLLIKSNLPGAVIFLDGKRLNQQVPDTLRNVETGRHYVSLYKEGFQAYPPMRLATVVEKSTTIISFELKSASLAGSAKIQVNANGYRVFVDGVHQKADQNGMVQVTAGYHTFMVLKEGYIAEPSFQRKLIPADDTTAVSFQLLPESEIGYLQISNNLFRGSIYLDDDYSGMKAVGDMLPVRTGIYEVSLRENGFRCRPDSILVQVKAGEKRLLVFRMEEQEKNLNLNVRSTRPGAAVVLDGEILPVVAPLRQLPVSPGQHYINLVDKKGMMLAQDRPLKVYAGKNLELHF
ncbi:MAG: PEGA domain-containing protein [Calditrichia bacterium]